MTITSSAITAKTATSKFVVWVLDGGASIPATSLWTYHSDDPWAVCVRFNPDTDYETQWTFGRELLAQGLAGQAGQGDIVFDPEPQQCGEEPLTRLALNNGEETAAINIRIADLTAFLAKAGAIVPSAEELEAAESEEIAVFQLTLEEERRTQRGE